MDDDDFIPDDDFVPDAPARKSKYPDPKSFSADDQALGIKPSKEPVRVGDVGVGRFAREVFAPSEMSETDAAIGQGDPAAIAAEGERIMPGVTGVKLATTLGKAGASEAARLLGKTSLAQRVTEAMTKALGKTTEHSVFARGVELLTPSAVGAAEKAAQVAAPALGAAARSVAPAAPAVARSALSNAVDRLRASAGISPSAMDFTRRMEEQKNTPMGTVSQGTLGGTP